MLWLQGKLNYTRPRWKANMHFYSHDQFRNTVAQNFVKHGVYMCCVDGFVGYSCSYKACVSPTINSLHAGSLNIGLHGTISLRGKPNNRLVK